MHFGGGLPPLLFDLRERSRRDCAISPTTRRILPVRLELAERLLAWRAEHLDQSLALSELTEDGVVGALAAAAADLSAEKARAVTARASLSAGC